ncbi:hypothetical protein ACQJBY_024561 [Aegilops geniculata]
MSRLRRGTRGAAASRSPPSRTASGVRFARVHSGQPRGRRHFERGEILEVVVITDKGTSRSNGGEFEAEAAIRACLSPYPMIGGRTATSHASGPEVQGTTTNCLFSH